MLSARQKDTAEKMDEPAAGSPLPFPGAPFRLKRPPCQTTNSTTMDSQWTGGEKREAGGVVLLPSPLLHGPKTPKDGRYPWEVEAADSGITTELFL